MALYNNVGIMRVRRSEDLRLNTTWQTIHFDDSDPTNFNFFNILKGETNPQVWWDDANSTFRFDKSRIRDYLFQFAYVIQGGLRPEAVDWRLEIPAPTPVYIPNSSSVGYAVLTDIERREERPGLQEITVHALDGIRNFGLKLQMRTDVNNLLETARPLLQDITCFISMK